MFQRIVLALDSGEAGAIATSCAISLARDSGGVIHVIHVNEHLFVCRGHTAGSPDRAAAVVTTALAEMQSAGVPATGATYRTTAFDVASTIADVAESWRADVIVVGSRRRRLGVSTPRKVRNRLARHTTLPVLTAPPPLTHRRHETPCKHAPVTRTSGSSLTP